MHLSLIFVCICVMGSSASRAATHHASTQIRKMASSGSNKVSKSGFDVTPLTAEQIEDAKKQLDPQEKHIVRLGALTHLAALRQRELGDNADAVCSFLSQALSALLLENITKTRMMEFTCRP